MKREAKTTKSDWLKKSLSRERLVTLTNLQDELIKSLVEKALSYANQNDIHSGMTLAAAFDFLIAVEYYTKTTNAGWLYCPSMEKPLLLYPYTNACPRCLLRGEFVFHKANKPPSGAIGKASRELLCGMLQYLFERDSRDIKIYLGYEPADVVFHDEEKNIVLLGEVKASPLTTLALAVESERQTAMQGEQTIFRVHTISDNSSLNQSRFNLFLPKIDGSSWSYELVGLGIKGEAIIKDWFYEGVRDAIVNDETLFARYFEFWQRAFTVYDKANNPIKDNVYWLTNACGQPKPLPEDWGNETISDMKTSVGMDRTDDIKKGTYQVLKLAASSKLNQSKYILKTALISNIHAVRHYDEYLKNLQDVVWTIDKTKKAKVVGDLPSSQEVYNLFDGIVSFTESYARDEWIAGTFKF